MIASLTERQKKFIAAYHDRQSPGWCHATKAAEVAGYAWPGKQGPRLLTFPAVKAEVDRQVAEYAAELKARRAAVAEAWAAAYPGHPVSRALSRARRRRK